MKYLWVFTFVFILITCGCGFDLAGGCNNHIHSQISSPDKKYKVVLFERGCGATSASSVDISVLNNNEKLHPDSGANVFTAYGLCDNAKISWKNDRELLIEAVVDTSRIFLQEEKWADIHIRYTVISN